MISFIYFVMNYILASEIENGKDPTPLYISLSACRWGLAAFHMGIVNGPDLAMGRKKASKIFSIKAEDNEGMDGHLNIFGNLLQLNGFR